MQLAKNLFLFRDKTLSRKLEEIVLADYARADLQQEGADGAVPERDRVRARHLRDQQGGAALLRAKAAELNLAESSVSLVPSSFAAPVLEARGEASTLGGMDETSPSAHGDRSEERPDQPRGARRWTRRRGHLPRSQGPAPSPASPWLERTSSRPRKRESGSRLEPRSFGYSCYFFRARSPAKKVRRRSEHSSARTPLVSEKRWFRRASWPIW